MNKFFYLFVALVAIGLSSCSKDDVSSVTETSEPAALKLTILGIGDVATKAYGGTVDDNGDNIAQNEGKINRLIVAVFKCTQSAAPNEKDPVDKIQEFTTITSPLTVTGLTSGNRSVIVVANYDDAARTELLSATTASGTRSDFLKKTIRLDVTTGNPTTPGITQVTDYLPMSGEAVGADSKPVINLTASSSASVNLSRLVARLSLNSITTAFAAPYSDATFTLNRIFVYGAMDEASIATPGNSTIPSTVNILNGGTVSGSVWTSGINYLLDEGTFCSFKPLTVSVPTAAVTSYTTPHYFYVFANDASHPVKLVIEGDFDIDGAAGGNAPVPTYYPIVINKTQVAGGTGIIDRNKIYKITATINSIGVSTPQEDIVPANLSLSIQTTPWTQTSQPVVFN